MKASDCKGMFNCARNLSCWIFRSFHLQDSCHAAPCSGVGNLVKQCSDVLFPVQRPSFHSTMRRHVLRDLHCVRNRFRFADHPFCGWVDSFSALQDVHER
jgi:hypothetical protein